MASNVQGTRISLTRGDTFRAIIGIRKADGSEYIPDAGDVIRFAVKKDYRDQDTLLLKTIPNDTLLLELEPQDTKHLAFGKYVYDIQITMTDGTVDTFIPTSVFELMNEVE